MAIFRLKRFDRLVTLGFIGPYIASFFVAEFVLVMQFMWKYIDDILGKGVSIWNIAELIFYYAVTIIPFAIPLTVLISSVMVFGDMAEKYELSSMKSAGVSLLRIMRAGIVIASLTAGLSIFCSNYLKPKANYKFFERFATIKRQKPSLSIEEGVFNNYFGGHVIRVNEKDPDGQTIRDILIYDQTNPDRSLVNLIKAKYGKMYTTEDGRYFVMQLKEGAQYKELKRKLSDQKDGRRRKTYPFVRTSFETWSKVFDMSEFDPNKRTSHLNRNKYDLLNTFQLLEAIDSVEQKKRDLVNTNRFSFGNVLRVGEVESQHADPRSARFNQHIQKEATKAIEAQKNQFPSTKQQVNLTQSSQQQQLAKNKIREAYQRSVYQQKDLSDLSAYNHFYETFDVKRRDELIETATQLAKNLRDKSFSARQKTSEYTFSQSKFRLRLNQQYSWALICILFLFIGGPLGSIVRKGGYGYPLLFAIIFFMIFVIMQIMGEKLHKSHTINAYLAAWIPCIVLAPIALFLTYKALNDSKIFNIESYLRLFAFLRKSDDETA